jgi:hypothetical protein
MSGAVTAASSSPTERVSLHDKGPSSLTSRALGRDPLKRKTRPNPGGNFEFNDEIAEIRACSKEGQ